jgi:hypothetical protein
MSAWNRATSVHRGLEKELSAQLITAMQVAVSDNDSHRVGKWS